MTRGRRITVRLLIWGTTVLAIIGIFAIWANRQVFSPDNWANTSTKLLQNEKIRDATANYLVEQLYANVDVEAEIKKRLPKEVQALAGPASGLVRTGATEVAKRALATAKVQEAWKAANRAADQTLVNIVEGGKGPVAINNGVVSLDLATVLTNITNRLGLPEVASKLPPNVAHLTVLEVETDQGRAGHRQNPQRPRAAVHDPHSGAVRDRHLPRQGLPPAHAHERRLRSRVSRRDRVPAAHRRGQPGDRTRS